MKIVILPDTLMSPSSPLEFVDPQPLAGRRGSCPRSVVTWHVSHSISQLVSTYRTSNAKLRIHVRITSSQTMMTALIEGQHRKPCQRHALL